MSARHGRRRGVPEQVHFESWRADGLAFGRGQTSMSKSNLPAPMKPWASPEGHGPHFINVEWAMPPASIPAAEFECQYGFRLLGKWFTHQRGLTDDPTMETRRIEPLKPNEKYIVRVRARFAGQGWGPWSPKSEVMATLPEGATASSSASGGWAWAWAWVRARFRVRAA